MSVSRRLSICTFAAILLPLLTNADDPKLKTVEELAKELKPSIVVITAKGRESKKDTLGTGFIVDPNGLIATNYHVIGEGRPIVKVNMNGFPDALAEFNRGKCVEVAQVGFGLVATRASVFAAMPTPWFQWRYVDGDIEKVMGEDGGWCDDARALGFGIFAHGLIRPYHTFPRRFRLTKDCQDWIALSDSTEKEKPAP